MATLRELRRKLQSVKNIKKITQAMEMIAAIHLRRAQAKAEMSRPYTLKLKEILDNLNEATEDFSHPLIDKREVKKTGFIIVAGDRGLCGAYNYAVFATAEKLLKKYKPEQVELFFFGRKAKEHFSGKKWKISEAVSDWGGKITYQQIELFTKNIIDQYLHAHLDEIWLIYTHFIHIAARKIVVEKFLNIETQKPQNKFPSRSYIFEPNVAEILNEILPRYLITKVQSALNEAYASELAARIFSMRAATKNAEETLESLTRLHNKVRQTSITRELIEITSGAESLK